MSQYPYDQPPQQYQGNQYQPEYGQPGYDGSSFQQQQYQPMPQPYTQNQGYQNPYNPNMYGTPFGQTNSGGGLAIAGMVLGIICIVLCWIPFMDVILGIVGLVLSLLGRRSSARSGIAIAGLVCSVIGLALSVIITLAALSRM